MRNTMPLATPRLGSAENEAEIRAAAEIVIGSLKGLIAGDVAIATLSATTADSPRYIPTGRLIDPTLLDSATAAEDVARSRLILQL